MEDDEPTPKQISKAREILLKHQRSAIALFADARPLADVAPYPSSYLGGLPKLPRDVEWPSFDGQEMTFIAQVDLRELPRFKENALPESGRLLFFSFTQFDRHPGNDVKWASVIHVREGQDVEERKPSDRLMTMASLEHRPYPWLSPTDIRNRVHRRSTLRFAPYASYRDTDGKWPGMGWAAEDALEMAYLDLQEEAVERAHASVKSSMPHPPNARAPEREPLSSSSIERLRGGPYTWGDVADYFVLVRKELDEARDYFEKRHDGVVFQPTDVGPDCEAYVVDLSQWLQRWSSLASTNDRWTLLPADQRAMLRDEAEELVQRHHRKIRPMADAFLEARRREARQRNEVDHSIAVALPYGSPVQGAAHHGLIIFNIHEAVRLGTDPETFYPRYLVDLWARGMEVVLEDPNVEPRRRFGMPHSTNQMLGYGSTIQMTPLQHADKVMLLQVFSETFDALGGDGVLQFWISPKDLKAMRFDRAFATADFS